MVPYTHHFSHPRLKNPVCNPDCDHYTAMGGFSDIDYHDLPVYITILLKYCPALHTTCSTHLWRLHKDLSAAGKVGLRQLSLQRSFRLRCDLLVLGNRQVELRVDILCKGIRHWMIIRVCNVPPETSLHQGIRSMHAQTAICEEAYQ